MQEGHSDSPFCLPEHKNDLSPVKGVLPASGEVHLCWQKEHTGQACVNKPCYLFH